MIQKQKKEALKKPPFFISYLITDPEEFGNTPQSLKSSLTKVLRLYKVDIICFRDKVSSDKENLAKVFLEVCREFSIKKVLINSDIELSQQLGFDGVHLNSQQFDKIKNLQNKNIFIIISCHNEKEIQLAKKNGAKMITYSPVFFKKNKGEPKGLKNLAKMVSLYQEDDFGIIGLGGIITVQNRDEIQRTQAKGFASIRYFTVK